MSLPIKPTPILRGKDAIRFLRDVEENLKKDHSKSFNRAKKAYNKLQKFIKD
jgi:hypothetical protein